MYYEKYGEENKPVIVFLHGANFIHTFGKQYILSDKYCLFVPHIRGYGNEADKIFETEVACDELVQFIQNIGKKVNLIGFSLGAQLAVKLIAEHTELFDKAIIVSPWLIKTEEDLLKSYKMNKKQLLSMKNKHKCNLIGLLNGLPKEQRKEFVQQMNNVKIETLKNMVYNNITFSSIPNFENIDLEMIALAGKKEQQAVIDSVRMLGEINKNCSVEIWEKASHNIPPVFAKRFNELISQFIE